MLVFVYLEFKCIYILPGNPSLGALIISQAFPALLELLNVVNRAQPTEAPSLCFHTTVSAPQTKLMKLWDSCRKDVFLKKNYVPHQMYFSTQRLIVFSFKSPVRE